MLLLAVALLAFAPPPFKMGGQPCCRLRLSLASRPHDGAKIDKISLGGPPPVPQASRRADLD
jgi:hypothetical protein